MAENRDMANLEARLTTLGSQVEHLAQIVPQAGVSSEDDWMTSDWMDRMSDFMEVMKQAKTKLRSFSRLERREENIKTKEESLVREAAQMTKREELLNQMTADTTKRQELSEQKGAEITKREELLEQNTAEMKKRSELLDHRAAEILKGEELLEQKTRSCKRAESSMLLAKLTRQKKRIPYNKGSSSHKGEKALEQRRKADEEMILRREDNVNHARESLDRHQQIVVQLHQSTKEQLDRIRVEQDDMSACNVTISKQLGEDEARVKGLIKNFGAEEARVQGLVKDLRKLRSSIATPLHNCEVALANIKEQARSLNIFEGEQRQEVTSFNSELTQISTSTNRHTAAMRSFSKDIEAIDTYRTRILDSQLEGISGKLANVSKVSAGLEALSMKFQDMQVAESNATESVTGAAGELRKATQN